MSKSRVVREAVCLANRLHFLGYFSANSSPWDVSFSSVQSLSCVQLFVTPWIAACQASLSITNSRRLLKLVSIESVMGRISRKSPLLLLLLSHFSRVRLCATPSLGFSRQEHWSGLPFPSPMYKSKKWKWSRSVMSDHSRPHGLQPTRLLCPWDFPGKSTGVGCHCLL